MNLLSPFRSPFHDDRFSTLEAIEHRPRFRLVAPAIVFLITRKKEEKDRWEDDLAEQA